MDARDRRPLAALLLVALLLRLVWVAAQHAKPVDPTLGDQFEYLQISRNLLAGQGLQFYDPRFEQTVYAYRTPGYPIFVAACRAQPTVVRFGQALLDTSTVLAIFLMARRFLGGRTSLIAGLLVAFNPFLIYFTGLLLTETLFTAMVSWGMYLLVRQRARPFAGLALLALAVHVRPSGIGLVLLLAAGAQWSQGWFVIGRTMALAAALVVSVLLPWAYRNAHHPALRAWVWTTTNNGVTTYDGFQDDATGASDQKGFVDRQRTLLSRMDEVERDAHLAQQAHQWIREHPGRSVELMGSKIARTWSPVPLSNEYGRNRLYVVIGLTFTVPLYVLILLGLRSRQLARSTKVFLLLPAVYFTAIHALSVGSLRYRIPAEPPMTLLAASALSPLLSTLHGPSRRKS